MIGRLNSAAQIGRLNRVRRKEAEVGGWWLAGDIDPSDCVAAYQAKGAASYAASKVNLASPGTYNATEGSAPDWDAGNGWKFNGTGNCLKTGVFPADGWSAIIRYSNANPVNYAMFFGFYRNASYQFRIGHNENLQRFFGHGGGDAFGSIASADVLAMSGDRKCYADGSYVGQTNAWGTGTPREMAIAARDADNPSSYMQCYVQAFAVYDATLTAAQIEALTDEMNAL